MIDHEFEQVISLGTLSSAGYTKLQGNYIVSNLLQELTLANDIGRRNVVIDHVRLNEDPVNRLNRFIKDTFWDNLTRVIDSSAIEKAGKDPKDRSGVPRPRIYIPRGAPEQFEYYTQVATDRPDLCLDVQYLPAGPISPSFVRSINERPGLLALEMEKYVDPVTGRETLRGLPFVVPGGRFNELYGWDSYMTSLGLLIHGRVDICKAMVLNFCFSIKHYGKILNANRTYYLCRSQPPFLTDMALRVYEKIKNQEEAKEFLKTAVLAAIKEYYTVWMAQPRFDPATGLSRYRPEGLGVPPETEPDHFLQVLNPYAGKHKMDVEDFVAAYNKDEVTEPELDEYFLQDRAVRESGHDTSYRLEHVAADLATVDLNSLLYKYEADIAHIIKTHFNDRLAIPLEFQTAENSKAAMEKSSTWVRRAKHRKTQMDKYLWSEAKGMFCDYNTVKKKRMGYESATTFWAMWSGLASPHQAALLVSKALPKLECFGGLVSGTEKSRGTIGINRPSRQWDYPFAWAPHQMLAWGGLQRYGYHDNAQALAYKWLYTMIKAFHDFNGVVVEKYDVTRKSDPHRVEAEYGNQGSDFRGVPREGYVTTILTAQVFC